MLLWLSPCVTLCVFTSSLQNTLLEIVLVPPAALSASQPCRCSLPPLSCTRLSRYVGALCVQCGSNVGVAWAHVGPIQVQHGSNLGTARAQCVCSMCSVPLHLPNSHAQVSRVCVCVQCVCSMCSVPPLHLPNSHAQVCKACVRAMCVHNVLSGAW